MAPSSATIWTVIVRIPGPAVSPSDEPDDLDDLLPGTILVDPWGVLTRLEWDGSETVVRGPLCGRPLEDLSRAA